MKRLALTAILLAASGTCLMAQSEVSGDKWIGWKWANFAILAAGLGYLIKKNLPAFFRARTESIQKDISEAQRMKRDAENRAAEMDARMNALGAEVDRFRAEAHAEMEKEGERIRQETGREIEKLQRQAAQEIESAGKAARRELKTYAAELALQLAEQRIRTRLDAATQAGLVDGFIQDLGLRRQQGSRN